MQKICVKFTGDKLLHRGFTHDTDENYLAFSSVTGPSLLETTLIPSNTNGLEHTSLSEKNSDVFVQYLQYYLITQSLAKTFIIRPSTLQMTVSLLPLLN